jgi:hypothetical protein
MQAPCERMKNPPAYAFHTFGGEGHGANRSELTAGVALPHVIAARVRHACGTLTVTADRPARTTKPAFSQYGHRPPVMRTTCGVYARGTEITPSTRRYPSANGDLGRRMTWSHATTSCTLDPGAETGAECDEPPKHDADNAPTSAMTTTPPRFTRTPGSYAHRPVNDPATVSTTAAASGRSAAGTRTNTTTTSTRGPALAARSCTARARCTRARSA